MLLPFPGRTLKTCAKCGQPKLMTKFYVNRGARDGRTFDCKSCRKKAVAKYESTEEGQVKRREYHNTPWGRYRSTLSNARSQKRYPLRARARQMVSREVQAGRLDSAASQQCVCGAQAEHLHHDDYNRPLDVTAYCAPCHRAWHRHIAPEYTDDLG